MAKPWVRWVVWGCVALMVLFLVWLLFPVRPSPGVASPLAKTLSNFKQVALASQMYAADYDDRLPVMFKTSENLRESLRPYTKNDSVFKSLNPSGERMEGNERMSGVELSRVIFPNKTVLLMEMALWEDERRVFAFADGHAYPVTDAWLLHTTPMLRDEEE